MKTTIKDTRKEMEIIRLRKGSAKIAFSGSRIKIDGETEERDTQWDNK